MDALATNGMMSVLAEPNLTAMSGEDAGVFGGWPGSIAFDHC
ncbi:hypothetical protein OH492_14300 [Vibrio chagasii]|nr:hypothetical protein [Vibrio chagasii]